MFLFLNSNVNYTCFKNPVIITPLISPVLHKNHTYKALAIFNLHSEKTNANPLKSAC